LEIRSVYRNKIKDWVREQVSSLRLEDLLRAVREGDAYLFEEALAYFALAIFSYHDVEQPRPESFYHAFLLGLMVHLGGEYDIRSNRESGYGRYDLLLIPRDKQRPGIVIELKSPRVRRNETLEAALADAVAQLRQKRYDTELRAQGLAQVVQWAIAVYGKDLLLEELAD
jgi:hypothetical protein